MECTRSAGCACAECDMSSAALGVVPPTSINSGPAPEPQAAAPRGPKKKKATTKARGSHSAAVFVRVRPLLRHLGEGGSAPLPGLCTHAAGRGAGRAGRRRATAEAELPQQQQAHARLAHVTLPAAAEAHVAEERVGEPPGRLMRRPFLQRLGHALVLPDFPRRSCSIG